MSIDIFSVPDEVGSPLDPVMEKLARIAEIMGTSQLELPTPANPTYRFEGPGGDGTEAVVAMMNYYLEREGFAPSVTIKEGTIAVDLREDAAAKMVALAKGLEKSHAQTTSEKLLRIGASDEHVPLSPYERAVRFPDGVLKALRARESHGVVQAGGPDAPHHRAK